MREFFYNINHGQIHLDMVPFFACILIRCMYTSIRKYEKS